MKGVPISHSITTLGGRPSDDGGGLLPWLEPLLPPAPPMMMACDDACPSAAAADSSSFCHTRSAMLTYACELGESLSLATMGAPWSEVTRMEMSRGTWRRGHSSGAGPYGAKMMGR